MALMLFLVFPLAYWLPGTDAGGCVENVWDSLAMVKNSRPLQLILLAFFISVRVTALCCVFWLLLGSRGETCALLLMLAPKHFCSE